MKFDIGQLLIIGFEPAEMTPELRSLLARIQPAGVILFARNILTPPQTSQLLKECRAAVSTPMFTCVDMEGGRVDRFRSVIGSSPSAAEVFATRDSKLFRKHGKLIGEACRALGFNVDFAPVLDLALEASRTVMSSRAVSADPQEVVEYAREFLAGLESAGIIGCGKHFPGLGEAKLDTHHELPTVKKPFSDLWEQDMVPYRMLRRKLPMVLIGHASYSGTPRNGKRGDIPASLSRQWITDVLRNQIGYRGLIVSDDMEMGGVLKAAPIEQAAVEFVRAGGDLCLICRQQEFVLRAYEALAREAERDEKFARQAAESVKRVLAFKKKSVKLRRRHATPAAAKMERLTRQLWEFSEAVRFEGL